MMFLLKSLISMNDFQKENPSAQTDRFLLFQTSTTRKYCKSKALNRSDWFLSPKFILCYELDWIGFNGRLQIHKTYLEAVAQNI